MLRHARCRICNWNKDRRLSVASGARAARIAQIPAIRQPGDRRRAVSRQSWRGRELYRRGSSGRNTNRGSLRACADDRATLRRCRRMPAAALRYDIPFSCRRIEQAACHYPCLPRIRRNEFKENQIATQPAGREEKPPAPRSGIWTRRLDKFIR